MALIDISVPLSDETPSWPGSPGVTVTRRSSLEAGDDVTASMVSMDVHAGTHVDAPAHMLADGATMDDYELDIGVGRAAVLDVGEAKDIDAETLGRIGCPDGIVRILLRTSNSRFAPNRPFTPCYAALTRSGARWLVENDVRLVGIDYLSIQRFDDPLDTHLELFRGGTTILEGLHLSDVEAGIYELICLPLSIAGCEAAPVRAVLKEIDG